MKAPELLLPAGGLERMRAAYDYGADAVYAGSPRYSPARPQQRFAKLDVLEQGIKEAHERNKNLPDRQHAAAQLQAQNLRFRYSGALDCHETRCADYGGSGFDHDRARKMAGMPIHLSVQANTTNYWGVKFWQNIGVERIILSRELSMEEIAEIRQECPDIELEVFIHGALCIAYSGRCLLSGYFNHRDPNQGTCTNSCRWDYKVHNAVESDAGDAQLLQGFQL